MPHEHSSAPARFLVENAGLLPPGKALDIAMGSGRNAVYLAGLGFSVEGVDASAQAIEAALEAAREAGVAINARTADLEAGFRIEEAAYDVIICFNYLYRPLLPQIKAGVRPGGVVIYETFIVDQAGLFGKPSNPDYLLQHNELLNMFRDFRCLRYHEGVLEEGRAAAGIVAQKENP